MNDFKCSSVQLFSSSEGKSLQMLSESRIMLMWISEIKSDTSMECNNTWAMDNSNHVFCQVYIGFESKDFQIVQ